MKNPRRPLAEVPTSVLREAARELDLEASTMETPAGAAQTLRELGCPPLALRLIEALVAAKFPAGRVELHLSREDLRAMLGAFVLAYEDVRGQ